MNETRYFKSQRVLIANEDVSRPAILKVTNGKILEILPVNTATPADETTDFGQYSILPGLVDTHAHINEPGRTDWEGFETATRAAAAGGITTVIDMPLNSIPATTSLESLRVKRESAAGKCSVDYGFWGGVVPGNLAELEPMIDAGVVGFKCFLIESGVDEFKFVSTRDLEQAMPILAKRGVPLIVHAELELTPEPSITRTYESYLQSRPPSWEVEAIRMMIDLCRKTGCRTHIVHLSAADALDDIRRAKKEGLPFTVETCPHYLFFDSEHISDGETHFKCAPPIRSIKNQVRLWEALKDGTIDFVVSDHSPCTPSLKKMDTGEFGKAWGGIAGLQFSFLSVVTRAREYGIRFEKCNRLMSQATSLMVGLAEHKGTLSIGSDADFFVFDPLATTTVNEASVLHRHKITPYLNQTLHGKILETYLRGVRISTSAPRGQDIHSKLNRGKKS